MKSSILLYETCCYEVGFIELKSHEIYLKSAKPNDKFPQMGGDNDLPKHHLAYERHRL